MKQRITALDLKAITSEASELVTGYRLQNIYNLVSNKRSFLLKFAKPDSKVNIVVESGLKVYVSEFQRPTLPQPSGFVVKLRKHLKTKRLTRIYQLGDDRICVMEFNDGLYYLVFEFFSAGNIVLLDSDKTILSLFRLVDEHENNSKYAVGETYSTNIENFSSNEYSHEFTKEEVTQWVNEEIESVQKEKEKPNSSQKSIKVLSIHKLLFLRNSYLSSDLIQVYLTQNKLEGGKSCVSLLEDSSLLETAVTVLNESEKFLHDLFYSGRKEISGYLISRKNPLYRKVEKKETEETSAENEEEKEEHDELEYVYDSFFTFNPIHKLGKDDVKVEIVQGYNKTLDKFFTVIESSKSTLKKQQQQINAEKRLQTVVNEQSEKISKLTKLQELNYRKGQLIMTYSDLIEECKQSVQNLINQQMDWQNIEKIIQMEQTRGNQIAKMIKLPLNLVENKITVTLPDQDFETYNDETDDEDSESNSDSDLDEDSDSDSDDESTNKKKQKQPDKTIDVIINLSISVYANSSTYFDAMKTAQEKQVKTEKSANMAIKNTEIRIAQDMKKLEKENLAGHEFKQLRRKFSFEKFYWFISSDGYLCLAGRDIAQIDFIYYRYFNNKTDLLVSNDLEDGLRVFIKNPYKNADIPPSTLLQAGIFSLSTTKAWENKMVTSPWFVKGSDVSKRDYDGSILPTGLLNISKEKTYLPPCQLVLGFGLLWIGDQETTKKYKGQAENRRNDIGLEIANSDEGTKSKIEELKLMVDKLGKQLEKDLRLINKSDDSSPQEVDGIEDDADNEEDDDNSVREASGKAPGPNDQIQVRIRGKKSKLKKIKQKYGDQDEEERKLRMSVLGTLKQVEQRSSSSNSGKATGNTNGNQPGSSSASSAINWRAARKKQQEHNQLKKILGELEESTLTTTDEGKESTEDAVEAEQDDDEGEIKDDEPYYNVISGLIPSPNKTDVIIDAIPVFAPWNSLQKFKYKLKVQTGNLKKGKTTNDVLEYFSRYSSTLKSEGEDWYDGKDLTSTINPTDALMPVTVSKMKVTYPGSSEKGSGNGNAKGKSKSNNHSSKKANGGKKKK
ncbi:hypothetical protein B5S32_g2344 [[Candida] boidinii]|nr:hypothetical protein B5S32_g2344 [[Candida] boidinii]